MKSRSSIPGREPVRQNRNGRRTPWIWAVGAVGFAVLAFITWDLFTYGKYIDAFSGATPRALRHDPPRGISLEVGGRVEKPWRVTTRSLRLLAPVRIRTREVSPAGEILGAYIHTGVPVIHVLAGVDPKPPADEPDDRPLDLMVLFSNRDGESRLFTYGELVLVDDALPVTLAWKREPLVPERGAENYKRNRLGDELSGLRLICPGEMDTARYLDDVVRMTLVEAEFSRQRLPPVRKHFACRSHKVLCLVPGHSREALMHGFPRLERSGWFRIGHGLGIRADRLADVSGISMRLFLKRYFTDCRAGDFFLVCGCDGYRVMLSGREIFANPRGERFLLMDTVDGAPLENGIMLGAFGDFFIDRCVRGVSHIMKLDGDEMRGKLTEDAY